MAPCPDLFECWLELHSDLVRLQRFCDNLPGKRKQTLERLFLDEGLQALHEQAHRLREYLDAHVSHGMPQVARQTTLHEIQTLQRAVQGLLASITQTIVARSE